MAPMPEGPFVQIATFCESVTRSEGGNMTVHNCVTMLSVGPPAGPILPNAILTAPIEGLTFALSLWPGDLRGAFDLEMTADAPNGESEEVATEQINFGSDVGGVDLTFSFPLAMASGGTYWFSAWLSGPELKRRRIARAPLAVAFAPVSATAPAEPVESSLAV